MQATLSEYEGAKPKKKSTKVGNVRTVENMKPGEFGWAVTWIVEVGPDRKLWIRKNGEVGPESRGTAQMMVRRTKNGVEVHFHSDNPVDDRGGNLIEKDLLPVECIV